MESKNGVESFFDYFGIIADKRQEGKVHHLLIEILFITVVATLCKMDDWDEIEYWAKNKEEWLRKYLSLPYGIPSKHTYRRIFSVINPKQFQKCFIAWMKDIVEIAQGTVIAIDGKTMRGTAEKTKKAIHIVSAWCNNNKLVLGQVKTEEKSNEIKAIPELLDLLSIEGAIVTIDAMGAQKDIAKKITKENKADYVFSLKDNQPTLKEDVEKYFDDALSSNVKSDAEKIEIFRTKEKGHGRIEERIYHFSTDIEWLESKKDWAKLNGIGMIIRNVEINGIKTQEKQYYMASVLNVNDFARSVRAHWGVESFHWNLDVTFKEDACRTRKDTSPENLAMLKRLAYNMLRKDTERFPQKSSKGKRLTCCFDMEYLEYIFDINFMQNV